MSLECSHISLSLFQAPGRRHLVVSGRESPDFHMGLGGVFVLPQYVHFLLVEEPSQATLSIRFPLIHLFFLGVISKLKDP